MARLALTLFLAAMAACARTPVTPSGPQPTLRHDGYDQAYLATRRGQDGCHGGGFDLCCSSVEQHLLRALADDALEEAAVQLELQALSCQRPLPEHIARFRDVPKGDSGARPVGRLSVGFAGQVAASDRIYWAGAFVDGKLQVSEPLAPGAHRLSVEMHVLPLSGVGEGQLYRLRRQVDFSIEAGKSTHFSVNLRRTVDADPDQAFLMTVQGKTREDAPAGPRKPPSPLPPNFTKGQMIMGGSIHPPSELYVEGRWMVMTKVCVAASGQVASVEPMIRMHPRDTGALLDWVLRLQHLPYHIDGVPTPYCYPLRFEVKPE
jgi:hypothetical protein